MYTYLWSACLAVVPWKDKYNHNISSLFNTFQFSVSFLCFLCWIFCWVFFPSVFVCENYLYLVWCIYMYPYRRTFYTSILLKVKLGSLLNVKACGMLAAWPHFLASWFNSVVSKSSSLYATSSAVVFYLHFYKGLGGLELWFKPTCRQYVFASL